MRGVSERTTVSPLVLPNTGGSIQQLPNFVGVTFKPNAKMTVGAANPDDEFMTQETDSQLITPTASGAERFAYSGDSAFSQREIALAAGYQGGKSCEGRRPGVYRHGFLRLVQSASDRIADSSGLKSLLVTSRVAGSAILLRAQAACSTTSRRIARRVARCGRRRDPSSAVPRSPSMVCWLLATPPLGASLFVVGPSSPYHCQLGTQGGASFVHERAEHFEVDVENVQFRRHTVGTRSERTYGTGRGPNVRPES